MLIEVFSSGKHRDSKGRTIAYGDDSISEIVNSYNKKITEDVSYMAPIVKGHPADDAPAYGWVEYLVKKGKKILAKVKNMDPQLKDELKSGKYKKVSIALYPNNLLKHVGFLGAASPAVKGLNPAQFSDTDEYICYEDDFLEYSENDENQLIKNRIKELEDKVKYYEELISEIDNDKKAIEFRDYCNSFINKNGRKGIKPIYVKYLTDIMFMADKLDSDCEIKHNSDIVREFIEQLADTADTSEFIGISTGQKSVQNIFEGRNVNENRMNLHIKALEFMKSNPTFSYNEAVNAAIK